MDLTAGFSVEAIVNALGGSPQPLLDAVTAGNIRGAAGIVGCNNPKIKHNYGHVTLAKELIKQDVLVVETGCSAIACAQAGLLKPEAADLAGPGLKQVCTSLGIPPVLHMGSCVDCSRILVLAAALGNALDVAISDLPLAGAAPEWYSQKAVSIASYFVSSGVYTVLGIPPKIFGSQNVLNLAAERLKDVVGATFAVEPDPVEAAGMMVDHIEHKRNGLGL
jgi:carbon-monoxide dehydrogenase catalytic subunit